MDWISQPVSYPLRGCITLPGDKSISHRALFFSALANGNSLINGFSNGADCLHTFRIFQQLGISIIQKNEHSILVQGRGKHGLSFSNQPLNCGNSGTTMRLLMGLLSCQPFDSHLIGDDSLQSRPMMRVANPLNQMGAIIVTSAGKAPIMIKKNSELTGLQYALPYASAQLKTALLFAGLYAKEATTIIEPLITRDHTERMFTQFNAPLNIVLSAITGRTLSLDSSYELQGTTVNVPGDFSAAAFFIVAATLVKDAQITLRQVGVNPTRLGLLSILNAMGADITLSNQVTWGEEPVADIHVRYAPLKGIQIPAEWVPLAIDEFPIVCIAAALAEGETCLTQVGELRHKESDRIKAIIQGLTQLGIHASATEDEITIFGGTLQGGTVSSYGDHRIAMAFAIAGCVAEKPVSVLNCDAVSTSFPTFIKCATQLGLLIKYAT